ncbi:MAG: hypothetical protein K6G16_08085 [Lachnospiraceae bacterium]|nr:hypothetical protein [Lachnospiraceae bacterium]
MAGTDTTQGAGSGNGVLSQIIQALLKERAEIRALRPDEVTQPNLALKKLVDLKRIDHKRNSIAIPLFSGLSLEQIDGVLKAALTPEEYTDFTKETGKALAPLHEEAGHPLSLEEQDGMRAEWLYPCLRTVIGLNDDPLLRVIGVMEAHPELQPAGYAEQAVANIRDFRHVSEIPPEELAIQPYQQELDALRAKIPADHPQRTELLASIDLADRMLQEPRRDFKTFLEDRHKEEQHLSLVISESEAERSRQRDENRQFSDLLAPGTPPGSSLKVPTYTADQSQNLQALFARKIDRDPEYLATIGRIMHYFDDMHLVGPDEKLAPEQKTKVYGFHKVLGAHQALAEAVQSGDPEAVRKAQQEATAAYGEMRALFDAAGEHFAPGFHVPGNMDVTRTDGVPMEFMLDPAKQAQINGAYSAFVYCHNNGIGIDAFLSDPDKYLGQTVVEEQERMRPAKRATKGSIGKNLAAMNAYAADADYAWSKEAEGAHARLFHSVTRTAEGIGFSDPHEESRSEASFQAQVRESFLGQRWEQIKDEASFYKLNLGDPDRLDERMVLYQTIAVAVPADIDYTRIGAGGYTEMGSARKPFSIDDYIRDPNRHFDYDEILRRTDTTIRDYAEAAVNAGLRQPDLAVSEMLVGAQEAHIRLLLSRRHEKGQPGYEALSQRVQHISETLDARLLIDEDRERMEELTAFYRQAEKAMDREAAALEKDAYAADAAFNKQLREHLERRGDLERKIRLGENTQENNDELTRVGISINLLIEERMSQLKDGYTEGTIPESYLREREKQLYTISKTDRIPEELPPFFANDRERDILTSSRVMDRAGITSTHPFAEDTRDNRAYRVEPYHRQASTFAVTNDKEAGLFAPPRMLEMDRVMDELSAKKRGGIFNRDSEEYTKLLAAAKDLHRDMQTMYDPERSPKGAERDALTAQIAKKMRDVQQLAHDYAQARGKGGTKVDFKQKAGARRYLAALDLERMAKFALSDYEEEVQKESRRKETAKEDRVNRPLGELVEIEEQEHPKQKKDPVTRDRSKSVHTQKGKGAAVSDGTVSDDAPAPVVPGTH